MATAVTERPLFLTGMLIQAQKAAHAELHLRPRHSVMQKRLLSEGAEAQHCQLLPQAYKAAAIGIVREYMASSDSAEVAEALKELTHPDLQHMFVKQVSDRHASSRGPHESANMLPIAAKHVASGFGMACGHGCFMYALLPLHGILRLRRGGGGAQGSGAVGLAAQRYQAGQRLPSDPRM